MSGPKVCIENTDYAILNDERGKSVSYSADSDVGNDIVGDVCD